MRRGYLTILTTAFLALGTACASTSQATTTGSAAAASAPSTAAQATAVPAASALTSTRLSGAIKSQSNGQVTMQDGTSFTVGPDALIIRSVPVDFQTIQPDDFVAVTAKRQADGTLLASIVNIFPESMRGLGVGQRPMNDGNLMTNATVAGLGPNLMTNATVDGVTGESLTVSFPDGSDQVELAPDARVNQFQQASLADLQAGATISAQVSNGIAQFVTIT